MAAKRWDEFANLLRSDDRQERGWVLLAHERAARVRKELKAEKDLVERLLIEADNLAAQGRVEEAKKIRDDAAEQYYPKHDLRPLLVSHAAHPPPRAAPPKDGAADSKP